MRCLTVVLLSTAALAQSGQLLPAISPVAVNQIQKCDQSEGADQGIRNANCVGALPATGGIADSMGALGLQTTSGDINVGDTSTPKPVQLEFGAGTYTGTTKYTMGAFSAIKGIGGAMGFLADQATPGAAGVTQLVYTGDTGDLITIPDHAFGALLRDFNAFGKAAGTSGNCIFSSPGSDDVHQFLVGAHLENVTCSQFAQDGFHGEDNIFLVNSWNFTADGNTRYGWYSAPNLTALSPTEIRHFGSSFTRNGQEQYYAVDGEHTFFGATFSAEGVANSVSCEKYTGSQADVLLVGSHSEGCGKNAVYGAGHIFYNPSNGFLDVIGSIFIPKTGAETAPAITYGSAWNGSSVLLGNVYGVTGAILDVTGTFGTVHVFDDAITPSRVTGDDNSNVRYLNDVMFRPRYRFGQAEINLVGVDGPIVIRMDDTSAVGGSTGVIARRNSQWEITGNSVGSPVATLDDLGNLTVIGTTPAVSAAQFLVKDGGSGTLRGSVGFSNFYETNGFWIQNGGADVLGWNHNGGTPTLMFPAGGQIAAVSGPMKIQGDLDVTVSASSPTYYLRDGGVGTIRGYLSISSFYEPNGVVLSGTGGALYSFSSAFTMPSGGSLQISGGSVLINSTSVAAPTINASTAYKQGGSVGIAGQVIRSDGVSGGVWSTLAAADLSNGTVGTGGVVLNSAISSFITGSGVAAHTIVIPKLTTGGTNGSITWNSNGLVTGWSDPT